MRRILLHNKYKTFTDYRIRKGINSDDNQKIHNIKYIGSDNDTDGNYYILESNELDDYSNDLNMCHLIRNVPRTIYTRGDSDSMTVIPIKLHSLDQVKNDGPIRVDLLGISFRKFNRFNSVFGVHTDTIRYGIFDFNNNTFTTGNNTTNVPLGNTSLESDLILNDAFFGRGYLNIMENALLELKFDPRNETIINPLYSDEYRTVLYYLEWIEPTADYYEFATYPNTTNVKLYRPKFLFSDDNTNWYNWNDITSVFEIQTPDNSDYFTYTEIQTKGNSYDEYLDIPESEWSDQFTNLSANNYMSFMINQYIPPIYVHTNVLLSDEDNYIYTNNDTTGNFIIEGNI